VNVAKVDRDHDRLLDRPIIRAPHEGAPLGRQTQTANFGIVVNVLRSGEPARDIDV
jgi:hypothetical protein